MRSNNEEGLSFQHEYRPSNTKLAQMLKVACHKTLNTHPANVGTPLVTPQRLLYDFVSHLADELETNWKSD